MVWFKYTNINYHSCGQAWSMILGKWTVLLYIICDIFLLNRVYSVFEIISALCTWHKKFSTVKTVWVQISWLLMKPADQDLHVSGWWKQCGSRSAGFWWSELIRIHTCFQPEDESILASSHRAVGSERVWINISQFP